MSDTKVVGWQARLDKCPHCNRNLFIIATSMRSIDGAIDTMIKSVNFHIDKICASTDKSKKLVSFDIRLEKKTKIKHITYESTQTSFVYEKNNKVIL